jgi:hypothetical protein
MLEMRGVRCHGKFVVDLVDVGETKRTVSPGCTSIAFTPKLVPPAITLTWRASPLRDIPTKMKRKID